MLVTITHSHAEGTLVEGTRRGDGSAEVLKAVVNPYTGSRGAWRWSRNLGSWYVPRSRDSRANTALIDATKTALESAGFTVAVEIDDTYRSTAAVEAAAVVRQEGRVEALNAKAERKSSAADAAWAAEQRAVNALPPGGEPIKVGHHSERRHRKAIERAHTATGKAVTATDEAKEAARRAAAAGGTTRSRYAPGVIRRRLDRLSADLRRFERARDGYTRTLFTDGRGIKHVETHDPAAGAYRERVLSEIGRVEDQIEYWSGELAKAAESGAQVWVADAIEVGDRVRYWGGWGAVAKVNTKSVGIAGHRGRLPFDAITAVTTSDNRPVRIVAGARVVEDASEAPGAAGA